MGRPYTKRDTAYWNRHVSPAPTPQVVVMPPAVAAEPPLRPTPFPDISYGSTEIARASVGGPATTSVRGPQLNNGMSDVGAFQNLRAMPSAVASFNGSRDGDGYFGAGDAVSLCVKAYGGVPVVRNAVEVAVEFSTQPIWVKSKNATVREFFVEWLNAIQVNRLVEQSSRAYYREAAAFFQTFHGQFGPSYFEHMQRSFGAKENRIPIRYELLNPMTISASNNLATPYTYVRLLSTWECERLRNPLTEQDKQVLADMPKEAREQIQNGSSSMGIYMPLDPKRLRFYFYKKQGYEPFGIPFIWPILPAIEWKLTLTKMDKALARTIEHAILLITMGEAPSKENGGNGINHNNIARVQNLLSSQTIGRVLVADYTTKGQWLIPDIQEILGPEKYQVVNEDIKEGLQSILTGDDKFANAQIKAQIFIQRLVEGQNRFLNDFLRPEIAAICKTMGFRDVPAVGFEKIDLQDATVMARIYAQLGQIGVLTAPQVVKAIETQILPDGDEMEAGQEAYRKAREKGLYEPLIGGQKEEEGAGGPGGRPSGSKSGKQAGTRKSSPIGTSKASDAFSVKTYAACLRESQTLETHVVAALKERFGVEGELSAAQQNVAHSLVKAIIATQPRDNWLKDVAMAAVAKPPAIALDVGAELDDIATTYQVDDFDAAILRHCRCDAPGAPDVANIGVAEIATAAAKAAVSEVTARHAAAPAEKLTIELKQAEGKPKTVSVVKTAQGFEFTEVRKDD